MSVLRIISNRLAGRRKTAEINIPLDTAIVIAKSAHDFWDVSFTKGWRSYFGENVSREEAGRFLAKQFEDSEKYPIDATFQVFTGDSDKKIYLDVRERVVKERLGEVVYYDAAFPDTKATLTYTLTTKADSKTRGAYKDKLAETLQHLRFH